MLSQDEVLKILKNNKGGRKYSKEEGKLLYEFIKALVEHHVSIRFKKYDYEKR